MAAVRRMRGAAGVGGDVRYGSLADVAEFNRDVR